MAMVLTATGLTYSDGVAQNYCGHFMGTAWSDVTASRVSGTNYTNTTGKPLTVVAIFERTDATHIGFVFRIDGLSKNGGINQDMTANGSAMCFYVIPPGSTYGYTSTAVLRTWVEC